MPQVDIHPILQLAVFLSDQLQGEFATVHQIFTGPVSGDALLLLDYHGAVTLVDLLTDVSMPTGRLDASDREVLVEVGNILLNACLGTFGNLLSVRISFTVPRLHLESLTSFVTSLTIDHSELHYALTFSANFRLRHSTIGGYLVIVLGVSSLDHLLEAVALWEASQIGLEAPR